MFRITQFRITQELNRKHLTDEQICNRSLCCTSLRFFFLKASIIVYHLCDHIIYILCHVGGRVHMGWYCVSCMSVCVSGGMSHIKTEHLTACQATTEWLSTRSDPHPPQPITLSDVMRIYILSVTSPKVVRTYQHQPMLGSIIHINLTCVCHYID